MKKIEFSKLIMASMIVSYFIGLFFGLYVINKLINNELDGISSALTALFSYIGGPVAVAVGFYSNKAKAENVAKINKNTLQCKDYESSNRDDLKEEEK